MQTVSSNFLAAVKSSNTPVFIASLYKNGVYIQDLDVASGSVSFDSTQNVQGSAKLVIADQDGRLTPKSMGDVFTPFGGTEIHIKAGFEVAGSVETVSLGWFIIWDMSIDESWSNYEKDGSVRTIRRGASIELELRDRSQKLEDYPFLVPTEPKKTTLWNEIRSVVNNIIPLVDPGFITGNVPPKLIYERSRFDALKSLAASLEAEPVMTPAGNLTFRKLAPAQSEANTAPALGWDLNITQYRRGLTRDNVFNCVVAKGKNSRGTAIIEYATLDSGPTAFAGPFGIRPIFYESDTLTTAAQVKAYAQAQLIAVTAKSVQTVPMKALPNPAIELGDFVTVSVEGSILPTTGRIAGWSYNTNGDMEVDVSLPTDWAFN
jgi:hypothetical protein